MLSLFRQLFDPDDEFDDDEAAAARSIHAERDRSPLFGDGGTDDDGDGQDIEAPASYVEMRRAASDDEYDDISLLLRAESRGELSDAEHDGDDEAYADESQSESSDAGEWAFADDSGAEDQWFSDEEQDDAFVPHYEYQFQCIDDHRLYAVRPLGRSDATVVIAREDHPLINYVERLAEDERIEMRALLAHEPVTVEQLNRQYQGKLPGCLRAFNCNVLLRPVRYRLFHAPGDDDIDDAEYERDGAVHISRAYRRPSRSSELIDETPQGLDPGDGYPSAHDTPLFVLGDLDPDAERRAATLVDIANGVADESELDRFEMRHNDGHMMQFSASKPTAAAAVASSSNAFTDPSPVHPDAQLRWFVVKMHYYVMYKAFTASCARSGSLQRMINEAQQRAGALGYAFGSPPTATSEQYYTPQQERAVIERMFEMSIAERATETNVETRRLAAEQCARELGDCVDDLVALGLELRDTKNEELRERAGALLDLAKRARDASEQLNDARNERLDDRFASKGADKNA